MKTHTISDTETMINYIFMNKYKIKKTLPVHNPHTALSTAQRCAYENNYNVNAKKKLIERRKKSLKTNIDQHQAKLSETRE